MKKNFFKNCLLTTSALAFSSSIALADVSISGSMQWHYLDQDPGASTAGASDDHFHSDNKVELAFTNKTDTGLTISMFQTIRSNGTEAVQLLIVMEITSEGGLVS